MHRGGGGGGARGPWPPKIFRLMVLAPPKIVQSETF